MLAVLLGWACTDGPTPPDPAPTAMPVVTTPAPPPAAPVATDPSPPSSDDRGDESEREPSSSPTVTREDGRTVLSTSGNFEEVVLIPGGLAFNLNSEIWVLESDETTARSLTSTSDPHSLVSDGKWLYWLGYENNGKLELATGEVGWLPRMGRPEMQQHLAVGDVLYGRNEMSVWRYEGLHLRQITFRTDEAGMFRGEIRAGPRMVFLPTIDHVDGGRPQVFLLRLDVRGKMTKVPIEGTSPLRWSVNRAGSVVFRGADDAVMQLDAKASKPRRLFDEPNLSAVCWCGRDVCTVVDDVIRRHRRGRAEAEPVVEDVGSVDQLVCSADRIAWITTHSEEHGNEIHVVPLE